MEIKKIIHLSFLLCFIVIATFVADHRVEGNGTEIITTSIPCGDDFCNYICKKVGCGGHYCVGGKCVQDPKIKGGPVCSCTN